MGGMRVECRICRQSTNQYVNGPGPKVGDTDSMFCTYCKSTTTFEVVKLL